MYRVRDLESGLDPRMSCCYCLLVRVRGKMNEHRLTHAILVAGTNLNRVNFTVDYSDGFDVDPASSLSEASS